MESPPKYSNDIPGARDGDPDYTSIVPTGEKILRVTRPNVELSGQHAEMQQCVGLCMIFPCFVWPLICLPCIKHTKWSAERAADATLVILTESAIYYYNGDHTTCYCCQGACTTGVSTRSIPLERITNIDVRTGGQGSCNQCFKDVAVLAIETAGNTTDANGVAKPELMLACGDDTEDFKAAVLQARSADRRGGNVVVMQQPTTAAAETKRFKVRMNSNADKVKIVVGEDMPSLMAAIKAKFELADTDKLRLFLTEDKIEIEAFDELSANDDVTVLVGAESLD